MEPVEEPRPVNGGDTRPAVFHEQAYPVPNRRHLDVDFAAVTGVTARVVHENPSESVDPFGRSVDPCMFVPTTSDRDLYVPRVGDAREPVRTSLGDRGKVNGRVTRWRRLRVKTRQPQQVIDDVPEALALVSDPLEGIG